MAAAVAPPASTIAAQWHMLSRLAGCLGPLGINLCVCLAAEHIIIIIFTECRNVGCRRNLMPNYVIR